MSNSRNLVLFAMTCTLMVCMMGAVSITIDNPADGTGAVWDTNPVDGTTTDCVNGSSVTGGFYKKSGVNWVWLGPTWLTATQPTPPGSWSTTPDTTLGAKNSYNASGDYKVKESVMDNNTFDSDDDENFWTIP